VRNDTETTKYDEIAAKLAHYCEIVGPETKIIITGHSLGAALATIFSLYASTEERFTKVDAIETLTFGCPFIGSWRFAEAIKHQEDVGKLRLAKIHAVGDGVPSLPPTFLRRSSRGAQYFHNGIDVRLPYASKIKLFGQRRPEVTYNDPTTETYFGSLWRQLKEFYPLNVPVRFWKVIKMHTLVEHKKRLALVAKEDPDSLILNHSLKELYRMRDKL